MSKPYFIPCEHLVVYKDFGFSDKPGETYGKSSISLCECERYMSNKSCINRGRCIIARESDSGTQISKKSFRE